MKYGEVNLYPTPFDFVTITLDDGSQICGECTSSMPPAGHIATTFRAKETSFVLRDGTELNGTVSDDGNYLTVYIPLSSIRKVPHRRRAINGSITPYFCVRDYYEV